MNRPNIVFILSDDQGTWSLGSYGNRDAITPTLDNMAEQGVRFENFYCASPVCSPARASILTGLMPSQHGVVDWLGGGSMDRRQYACLQLPRQDVLNNLADDVSPAEIPEGTPTLPFSLTRNFRRYTTYENGAIDYLDGYRCYTDVLAENGYDCALVGKWHLGGAMNPQHGFRHWSVVPRGSTAYTMPEWVKDGKLSIGCDYATDRITGEAVEYIEGADREKPFYLSVHYTAPHDPWRKCDHPEQVWNRYNQCAFSSMPKGPLHPNQVLKRTHPENEAEWRALVQAHYTSITAMDGGIGKILDALKNAGQLENTVVFFTADNGLNMGHHGIWGKGNGTYPMNLYETSVKVPCIAWGPAYFGAGVVRHELHSHYDFFETLLDLAGCPLPQTAEPQPGRSFLPALQNEELPPQDVVVYDEYGFMRMIRSGDWKLICRCDTDECQLYHLKTDPDERENLAQDPRHAALCRELREKMDRWFKIHSNSAHDGVKYPVNGEGQMQRLECYGSDTTVFLNHA